MHASAEAAGAHARREAWGPIYQAILTEFGWHEADDRAAAKELQRLLPRRDAWHLVGTELKHRPAATVVGCGPALDTLQAHDFPPGIVVAADGATARLRELGITPRVVVTDLDGDPGALAWAGEAGAALVVHAHGHNRDRVRDLVPRLGPILVGTYQCTPDPTLAPLHNLGGFTDGDRAVALCEAYNVHTVHLVAFDFHAPPSRHSHHFDPATKTRKLAWAKRLVEEVHARGTTRVAHWDPAARGAPEEA